MLGNVLELLADSATDYVLIAVPSAVALGIAAALGTYWHRRRRK